SNSTNSVKATWIDARSQPNVFWMSGTKKVQPYCRLAIITMQMTPTTSCVQGDASNERVCMPGTLTVSFIWVLLHWDPAIGGCPGRLLDIFCLVSCISAACYKYFDEFPGRRQGPSTAFAGDAGAKRRVSRAIRGRG